MGIDELLNRQERHTGPIEGVIATAPDSMDSPVWVNILGDDDVEHREGPCAWIARGELGGSVSFPEEGDACAVVVTDAGTPIVIAWWTGEWPGG